MPPRTLQALCYELLLRKDPYSLVQLPFGDTGKVIHQFIEQLATMLESTQHDPEKTFRILKCLQSALADRPSLSPEIYLHHVKLSLTILKAVRFYKAPVSRNSENETHTPSSESRLSLVNRDGSMKCLNLDCQSALVELLLICRQTFFRRGSYSASAYRIVEMMKEAAPTNYSVAAFDPNFWNLLERISKG